MTRRVAIRRAILLAFGIVLGRFDGLAQASQATVRGSKAPLTVDLDQWSGIKFTHKGRTATVSVADIFDALTRPDSD